jgi:hypothetical protein
MGRITLSQAARAVDSITRGKTLTDRDRFIAARHLQRRLAGETGDRQADVETFDAWELVNSRHTGILRLL